MYHSRYFDYAAIPYEEGEVAAWLNDLQKDGRRATVVSSTYTGTNVVLMIVRTWDPREAGTTPQPVHTDVAQEFAEPAIDIGAAEELETTEDDTSPNVSCPNNK